MFLDSFPKLTNLYASTFGDGERRNHKKIASLQYWRMDVISGFVFANMDVIDGERNISIALLKYRPVSVKQTTL